DRFVDALVKRVQALRVGDALAPDTEMGPVISEEQLQIDLKYLQLGKEEGATLLCGGERLEKSVKGYYLSPALFVDTRNEMRINREEIFGPIATIIKVEDREEAISIANDTDFGLSAGIITRDAKFGAR